MSCKFIASDQPRVLPGRHGDECPGECAGCLPCPQPHCQTCGYRHAATNCAECVGQTREDIVEIAAMCAGPTLPTEAVHRGVDSEAAMLEGPAASSDVFAHRLRLAVNNRLCECKPHNPDPEHPMECRYALPYINDARDESHPLYVLGSWDLMVCEQLGHDRTLTVTIERAASYLDGHLSDLAADSEFPFAQMAGEIRACRAHLEAVLHDQNQGDRANVGCFECGGQLERKLIDRKAATKTTKAVLGGFEDVWTCRRCGQRYTYAEYNFALRAALEVNA